jgi:hypothetical protein
MTAGGVDLKTGEESGRMKWRFGEYGSCVGSAVGLTATICRVHCHAILASPAFFPLVPKLC